MGMIMGGSVSVGAYVAMFGAITSFSGALGDLTVAVTDIMTLFERITPHTVPGPQLLIRPYGIFHGVNQTEKGRQGSHAQNQKNPRAQQQVGSGEQFYKPGKASAGEEKCGAPPGGRRIFILWLCGRQGSHAQNQKNPRAQQRHRPHHGDHHNS